MEIFSTIFVLISLPLLFLFLILSFVLIRIFTGKSINDPKLLDFAYSLIFTVDTRNVEHILKTNFDKYAKGAYHQELVRDLWGQGIFAVDGDKWRQQRKLASFEFSTRVLRDFSSSVFRKNAVKLVRAVSELTRLGQAMKFQDMLMKYTVESMFKVGFGIDLNCMEGSSEEGTTFVKAFDDANELVYMRYIDPFWKLKRALNIGSEASLKKNIKVIDNFIHNIISTKKKLLPRSLFGCNSDIVMFSCIFQNVKEDILSRFLIESVKNPETMTDQYLRDIILNFLIAGKDASANTLSRFVYMLCKHRLIQEKVAQEVMDIACSQGNDASVDDFITTITDATLEKMHYLHAALTETLRLYPTVPPDGRCSLADDILPMDTKSGKEMRLPIWPIPWVECLPFGERTLRFLDQNDGLKTEFSNPNRHSNSWHSIIYLLAFALLPAGGPSSLFRQGIRVLAEKIFSIALIRYFRFKLADDTKIATYRVTFTLQMRGGLQLYAVPRTT
ncbi:Cytochrome P450, family 704, subfamily A, polypeptide 2, putative [Theobroma cacao]|uniref:Cytochrome P450, family 704, subfamily A, polypeptide 2, putative n=1 Tax=Theobroma cacao TaxID=3641 RepID=A0A061DVX0_THECC|nr:Cytochrome P450, family 704, subfamily A, polypeptide 2, putative [Theobroma cacao]